MTTNETRSMSEAWRPFDADNLPYPGEACLVWRQAPMNYPYVLVRMTYDTDALGRQVPAGFVSIDGRKDFGLLRQADVRCWLRIPLLPVKEQ